VSRLVHDAALGSARNRGGGHQGLRAVAGEAGGIEARGTGMLFYDQSNGREAARLYLALSVDVPEYRARLKFQMPHGKRPKTSAERMR
jgi:hypothetical protein